MSKLEEVLIPSTQQSLLNIIRKELGTNNVNIKDMSTNITNNIKTVTMTVVETEVNKPHHSNGCGCDECYDLRNNSTNTNTRVVENGKTYMIRLSISGV